MKTVKLLFLAITGSLLFASCTADVYVDDGTSFYAGPTATEILHGYELWYVDIHDTQGVNEAPFMHYAFTISFRNGVFYANNNISGIGTNGNGFGLDVGLYDSYTSTVTIDHDLDGIYSFDVIPRGNGRIELYSPAINTSYFLTGYQRSSFDYDLVFTDNIFFLMQEFTAWRKTNTANQGTPNPFDNENYLAFFSDSGFQSSQDVPGTNVNDLLWDYTGVYNVADTNNMYLKNLTLDYDYMGNDYFQLDVINDNTVDLYHESSGSLYTFKGTGYIQLKNNERGKKRKIYKKKKPQVSA